MLEAPPPSTAMHGMRVLDSLGPAFAVGEKLIEVNGEFIASEQMAVELLSQGVYPMVVKVIQTRVLLVRRLMNRS